MFASMKLSVKLMASFGIIIALLLGYGTFALISFSEIGDDVTQLADSWLPSIREAAKLEKYANEMRRVELRYLVLDDAAQRENLEKSFGELSEKLRQVFPVYEKLITSQEERAAYTRFRAHLDAYLEHHKLIIKFVNSGKIDQARLESEGETRKALNNVTQATEEIIAINEKGGTAQAAEGIQAYVRARNIGFVALGSATILGMIIALWLTRGILAQLGEDPAYLAQVAGQIAAGNLNVAFRPQKKQGGVYHVMQGMVATMKTKIAEADKESHEAAEQARKAQEATRQAMEAKAAAERAKAEGMMQAAIQLETVVGIVTSASEELSAQVEQSSKGAEVQTSRVGETATAMEEMNATVLEVSRNASQAAESTDKARAKATEGAQVVQKVMAGMEEMQTVSHALKSDMNALGRQAEGIGQIMNVISDIADQTNLLALNAAIEAARAGDAGRGFAVVADEVRKLAEKTMTATKEVGEAISAIQAGTRKNLENTDRAAHSIEQAAALAQQSSEALAEIVSMVDRATDQVRSIATASEEQSATSDEINRSIEEINKITTETSDAMGQSATAVAELASQAQKLRRLIESMKTGA